MKNFVKVLLTLTVVGAMVLGMVVFASDVTDPIIKPIEPPIVQPLSDVTDP